MYAEDFMVSLTISCLLRKCSNELAAVHLLKAYCLPTMTYGCEVWSLTDTDLHRITVALNNCVRRVLNVVGEKASDLFSSSAVVV